MGQKSAANHFAVPKVWISWGFWPFGWTTQSCTGEQQRHVFQFDTLCRFATSECTWCFVGTQWMLIFLRLSTHVASELNPALQSTGNGKPNLLTCMVGGSYGSHLWTTPQKNHSLNWQYPCLCTYHSRMTNLVEVFCAFTVISHKLNWRFHQFANDAESYPCAGGLDYQEERLGVVLGFSPHFQSIITHSGHCTGVSRLKAFSY